MKTAEYIKKYDLLNPETDKNFNAEHLVDDLGLEFRLRLENELTLHKSQGREYTYNKFKQLIKEIKGKFDSIGNKKIGLPLSDKVFSRLYAIYIIPARRYQFPVEHERATKLREEHIATMEC